MLWLCPAGQKCVRSYRLPGVFPADNIVNSRIGGAMFGLFEDDYTHRLPGVRAVGVTERRMTFFFASSWSISRFLWRATLLFCVVSASISGRLRDRGKYTGWGTAAREIFFGFYSSFRQGDKGRALRRE